MKEQQSHEQTTKRKRYTGAFKAKVGLEALMGIKTVGQIAREYQVHPVQVTQWKGIIRDHLPELFESPQAASQDQEQLIAQLHEKIGQLSVEVDWLKKVQATGPVSARKELIESCPELSLQRRCELIGISRSGFYYEPVPESPENLALMRRLDELHLEHPVYGSRRLTAVLRREGREVNRKRVARLLALMGVEVIYPKRNLSQPGEGHRIYPYLLEGLQISGPDQVWCSDITYVPMAYGFMYLVAVMDWWSRCVLAWELSNSLDSEFCIRAWTGALAGGRQPLISNTDQGSQFTSEAYLEAVESVGVDVSMDGRGRWIDNRFIERLWRSVKQEDIYVQDYADGLTAHRGIGRWFGQYNTARPHQALGYATPAEVYHSPESYGSQAGRVAVEIMTEAPTASSPPFAPSPLTGLRGSLRAGRRSLGVVE